MERNEIQLTIFSKKIHRAIRRKFHNDDELAEADVRKLVKYLNLASARFTYHVFDISQDYYRVSMIRRNTINELNSTAVKKTDIGMFLAREIACEISWE